MVAGCRYSKCGKTCIKARRVSQAVFRFVSSWLETWWRSSGLPSASNPAAFGLDTTLYCWEGNWSTGCVSSKGVQCNGIVPLLDSAFHITVMVSFKSMGYLADMMWWHRQQANKACRATGNPKWGGEQESMSVSLSTEGWRGVRRCLWMWEWAWLP